MPISEEHVHDGIDRRKSAHVLDELPHACRGYAATTEYLGGIFRCLAPCARHVPMRRCPEVSNVRYRVSIPHDPQAHGRHEDTRRRRRTASIDQSARLACRTARYTTSVCKTRRCAVERKDVGQGPGRTAMREGCTDIVHLVRHVLEPALARLDAGDHVCELRADDGLRVEGTPKDDTLVRPLEALLDNPPLCSDACAHHHPPLVVEVAQDHLQALVHWSQRMRDWHPDVIEGNIGRACGRGVGSLDGLRLDVIVARDEDDGEPFL